MTQQTAPVVASPVPSRALRIAAIALCVFAVTGCSTVRGWFGNSEKAQAKALTEPAPLVDITPSVSVSRLWSANAGKGYRGANGSAFRLHAHC